MKSLGASSSSRPAAPAPPAPELAQSHGLAASAAKEEKEDTGKKIYSHSDVERFIKFQIDAITVRFLD